MAKVLYITANPKPVEQSLCLSVGKVFLEEYRKAAPNDQVTELDVYQLDIPFLDPDVFSGWGKLMQNQEFNELSPEEQAKVGRIDQLCNQFVGADKYIFVTPMWNLGLPPKMKAYIDTICIAGKAFKYTEQGPVGLLNGKKGIHIQARGGVYSSGPAKGFEFGDSYLRALMTFLGVTVEDSVIIEGAAQAPDQAEQIKAKAIENGRQAAKKFAG